MAPLNAIGGVGETPTSLPARRRRYEVKHHELKYRGDNAI